ncbi:uncharacterized protein LOC128342031 [Hemicordylus capensis]|uniref:uncharacterized protein LOC128342031 n=1 Tax=Hemicordylus capensis TaxID=884348 RepID=UPI00230211C3|nr:uncharacterized protein LOC128342031 [Hemicordylus capensis]
MYNRNYPLAVTVNSSTHQYILRDLKEKTHYKVQISGITSKGEGAPSQPQHFTTLKYDQGEFEGVVAGLCLGIMLIMAAAVMLFSLIFKRTRKQCWPEVPNPKFSSAIQNMENTIALGHLGSSLHPLLQSQPPNGATELLVLENCSNTLLVWKSPSEDRASKVMPTDQSEGVAREILDATPSPLKSPDKGNASEKGKAGFHSDYASVEVSNRAMQALGKSSHKHNPPPNES